MSAQASKAARNLAADIGARFDILPESSILGLAIMIDSALGDLLSRTQTVSGYIDVRWGDTDATIAALNKPLMKALEPWKE